MKTRARTFVRGDQKIVLIGMMHIGTESYYAQINEYISSFKRHQVLYEKVKIEDKTNPLIIEMGKLYMLLADVLGLELQLLHVRPKKNWINADLDLEILESAKGKPLKDIEKLRRINKRLEDESKHMYWRGLFRFFIRFLLPIILKFADKPVILTLRNYKVVIDIFEALKKKKKLTVIYGDAHRKGIEEYLTSVGFELYNERRFYPLRE